MNKTLRMLAVTLGALWTSHAGALVIGQLQTFDDPHSWVIGAGPVAGSPTPIPIVLGGPGGPADPFLNIVATGGAGPQSRLSAQNFVEWSGDYLAAGIDVIRMDVRNFGTTDVFLRLLFLELGPSGPVSLAFSANAIVIPGGSDWRSITFDVSPGALLAPLGSAIDALSNASELRLFHNPDAFFVPGSMPPIVANLGVDNIEAAQRVNGVPEPSPIVLFATALAAAGLARRGPLAA